MPRKAKYPFASLEIGEAFTVPAGYVKPASLAVSCQYWQRKLDRLFSYRTNPDGSLTVWRRDPEKEKECKFEIHEAPRFRTAADIRKGVDEALAKLRSEE